MVVCGDWNYSSREGANKRGANGPALVFSGAIKQLLLCPQDYSAHITLTN